MAKRGSLRAPPPAAVEHGAADLALFGTVPLAALAGTAAVSATPHPASTQDHAAQPKSAPATHSGEDGAAGNTTANPTPSSSAGPLPAPDATAHGDVEGSVTSNIAVGTQIAPFVAPGAMAVDIGVHGGATMAVGESPAPSAAQVTSAPALADAVEIMRSSADALNGAIGDLSARLQAMVPDAHALAGAALDDIQARVGSVVDHLTDVQHDLLGNAHDDIAALTGSVTSDVAALVDAGTDTLATHLAGVGELVDHALGGSDPVAGITTLVGMVSAADVFSLHDAGTATDIAPTQTVLGTVDMLADIVPHDALLGLSDHHDGLLGGLVDHHGGLFGHG